MAKSRKTTTVSDIDNMETLQSKNAVAMAKAAESFEKTSKRLLETISQELTKYTRLLEDKKLEHKHEEQEMANKRQEFMNSMAEEKENAEKIAEKIKADAKDSADAMVAEAKAKTVSEISQREKEINKLISEFQFQKAQTSRMFAEEVKADKEKALKALLEERDLVTMSESDRQALVDSVEAIRKESSVNEKKAIAAAIKNVENANFLNMSEPLSLSKIMNRYLQLSAEFL